MGNWETAWKQGEMEGKGGVQAHKWQNCEAAWLSQGAGDLTHHPETAPILGQGLFWPPGTSRYTKQPDLKELTF